MPPDFGSPKKEVTQSNITRVLVIGFTLVILFLAIGGSFAFRNIVSVRENVATLVREQNVNRKLAAILHTLTESPAAVQRLAKAEQDLRRIEAEAQPAPTERPLWDSLLNSQRHEAVIAGISTLIAAGYRNISTAESEIDRRVSLFNGQSIVLLIASLGLALVCSIFTVSMTRDLFRNMAFQENELARVSWQMLADQESIARRFSHEIHDELGQTLAALRANLTASQTNAARLDDSISLTDDAIRSVRQLSQLLRPTILDDFGLDAGLNWLCEGFSQRTGIEVDYQSTHHSRLPDETETQLFRIAQEALTNVARHSGATKVTVELCVKNGRIRLRVIDNGKGMVHVEPHVQTFGMTGMRTRARVAGGVFRVATPETGGLIIDVRIPVPDNKADEPHPNPAG